MGEVASASSSSSGSTAIEEGQQCYGLDPQDTVTNYLGMELDYELADRICCHNHRFAEPRGYLEYPDVDFFGHLEEEMKASMEMTNTSAFVPFTFYDSVCGIPLFLAPKNRTYEEFKEESLHHGWPSFRPEEIISENVIIHDDGRMESKCLTHLGHNLPTTDYDTGKKVDRYCIDLVCMAGTPISIDDGEQDVDAAVVVQTITAEDETLITVDRLDVDTYISTAEQSSGKDKSSVIKKIVLGIGVSFLILTVLYVFVHWRKRNRADTFEMKEKYEANSNDNHNLEEIETAPDSVK